MRETLRTSLHAADVMEGATAQQPPTPAAKAHPATAAISNSIFRPPPMPANVIKPQTGALILSKLPGELRNRIWRLAVVEDAGIPINVAHYRNKDGEQCGCIQIQHALMHVSKQVRHEITEIYYLENTFQISEEVFKERAMGALIKTLKPWAENIARLEVSHKLKRYPLCATHELSAVIDINLTVRREEGRIVVAPSTGNIDQVTVRRGANGVFTETREVIAHELCCCKIASLVNDHATDNVLGWTQKYVTLVNKVSEGNARQQCGYMAYCWNCTGLTMLGPTHGDDEIFD